MNALATRFGQVNQLRSHEPLTEDQIRRVAPSIYAEAAHESRSERYAYIATAQVLQALTKEGFRPFMVAQSKVRDEGRREHTKHMLRLRHASQIDSAEAQEVILLNSHDGTSSYQMLGGFFRFVCCNGMVCGDKLADIRIPHKGNVVERVVGSAFEVLDGFTRIVEDREAMAGTALTVGEQLAFGRAALELKYDTETAPAPITERQIIEPRRMSDRSDDLWTTFNRVQENLMRGGQRGRAKTGRAIQTRGVQGIDSNVKLNRALWVLASEMQKLRAA